MTLRFLAAGLAVALLASPAVLARGETGQFIVAAADTDVTQYLSETRPLSSLSDKELKQRIRAGRQLAKGGSLSSDEMKKVRAAMRTAIQELKSRGSADKTDMSDTENGGATADQSGAGSAGAAAESDQGQKKKKKAEQQATGESANAAGTDQSQNKQQMAGEPTKAAATGDAAELIADSRPLGSLDEKTLRQKLKSARSLMKGGSLSQGDGKKVRQIMQAVRAELKKRGKGGDETDQTGQMPDQGGQTAAEQGAAKGAGKEAGQGGGAKNAGGGSAAEYLADNRALDQFSEKDLRRRMKAGRQLIKDGSLSQAERKKVEEMVRSARLEIVKRGGKAGGKNASDQAMAEVDTGRAGGKNKNAAGSGPAVMAVAGDAAKLDDQSLRGRVKNERDQLGGGNLSADETKALRQKLASDRQELRQRVARKLGKGQGETDNQASADWRKDQRESKALNDRELEGRLAFYRGELGRGDLTPDQKAQFKVILDRDRQEFRARALALRDDRVRKLKTRVASKNLNIQIDINAPGPPAPVWAAEADDQTIVTQLVRRPGRNFDRRYTFEEVTSEPQLREALPAVEIDTVTFGFNEDFVREEQLPNLDRIGQILEGILAEHPQEVFLVEGHTDAVGDDAYNLDLSQRRAEAIKTALTQYYAINPENLRTIGYGERYLKIPTQDPEEENRRITIRRITPAIGELQG